jgi:hypothetical protein
MSYPRDPPIPRVGEELSIPRHSIDPRATIVLTLFSGIAFPLEHVIHPAEAAGEDGDGPSTTLSANKGLWRRWQWGGSGAEGADRWGGRWRALGGKAAPPGDRWRRGRATRSAAAAAMEYFQLFIWGRSEFLTLS